MFLRTYYTTKTVDTQRILAQLFLLFALLNSFHLRMFACKITYGNKKKFKERFSFLNTTVLTYRKVFLDAAKLKITHL